jgi:hypothetical protein
MLIVAMAVVAAGLLAAPASAPDLPTATSVYPLATLPLIVAMALAGTVAVCLPRSARVAAIVGVIAGMQVVGSAVVASRDWFNYAGAGNSTYGQAAIGSQVSLTLAATATATVIACLLLYRHGADRAAPPDPYIGRIVAGMAVVVLLPLLTWPITSGSALSGAGQIALCFSLPWGIGIAAAGSLGTATARRAALLSVAGSVVLTGLCSVLHVTLQLAS